MSNTSRDRSSGGKRPQREVEASPLESHLGYWLRFVSNHVSHAFKVKVERRGVTVAEWVVMRALLEVEGIKPSELSERIGLTRGAVSKLVDRLATKGLVLCEEDPVDRRSQRITLTETGRGLVPQIAALADENDAEMFGHLDERERSSLLALLQGLARRHALKGAPVD